MLNVSEAVLKGKYIILYAYIKEQETLKICKLGVQQKKLKKEQENKSNKVERISLRILRMCCTVVNDVLFQFQIGHC